MMFKADEQNLEVGARKQKEEGLTRMQTEWNKLITQNMQEKRLIKKGVRWNEISSTNKHK